MSVAEMCSYYNEGNWSMGISSNRNTNVLYKIMKKQWKRYTQMWEPRQWQTNPIQSLKKWQGWEKRQVVREGFLKKVNLGMSGSQPGNWGSLGNVLLIFSCLLKERKFLGDSGNFHMTWYILTRNIRLILFIVIMDMTSSLIEINSLIFCCCLHT